MSGHTTEHDERLQALLVGDASPEDEPLRAQLADCATCRELWDEYSSLATAFETTGREAEELGEQAADLPASKEEERLLEAFRLEMQAASVQAEHGAPGARLLRFALVISAVAALLLVSMRMLLPTSSSDPGQASSDPMTLGAPGLHCLAPLEGDGYERFDWSFDGASADVTYDLRVYGPDGELLARATGLAQPGWTPSAEQRASWPGRIFWEVVARDATSTEVGSGAAEASRP